MKKKTIEQELFEKEFIHKFGTKVLNPKKRYQRKSARKQIEDALNENSIRQQDDDHEQREVLDDLP